MPSPWYMGTVRGCAVGYCVGQVGDANGSGDNKPTLGDISGLIDYLFITGPGLGLNDCF